MDQLSSPLAVTAAAVFGGLGLLWMYKRLRRRNALASLQGKVVLITGASSGIGEACAHAFHRVGCKVILSARRLNELERVQKDIISQTSSSHDHDPRILQMDIGDLTTVPEKMKEALTFHGRIDILVNNAGMSYRGIAVETKMEVHQKLMLVNYFGTIAVTNAVLPHMISNRQGIIIAVSSIQGKVIVPYRTAYTASKHAMQAFFDALRTEISQYNIHVCVNSPSYVKTNISLNAILGDNSQYGKMASTIATGMTAEYLADRLVLQTAYHEPDVCVGPLMHRLAPYFRLLLPGVFRMYMNSIARSGLTGED